MKTSLSKKQRFVVIDEPWKLVIVARDANRAEDVAGWLVYHLTDAGNDTKKGLDLISQMSGKDIVAVLQDAMEPRIKWPFFKGDYGEDEISVERRTDQSVVE